MYLHYCHRDFTPSWEMSTNGRASYPFDGKITLNIHYPRLGGLWELCSVRQGIPMWSIVISACRITYLSLITLVSDLARP